MFSFPQRPAAGLSQGGSVRIFPLDVKFENGRDWSSNKGDAEWMEDETELDHWCMPVIVYGLTKEGATVRVRVTGFRPWFYLAVPDALASSRSREEIMEMAEGILDRYSDGAFSNGRVKISPATIRNANGYRPLDELVRAVKVSVRSREEFERKRELMRGEEQGPCVVADLMDLKELSWDGGSAYPRLLFDAGIPVQSKFPVTSGMMGTAWATFRILRRTQEFSGEDRLSNVCAECECSVWNIDVDAQDVSMPPLRILSYDGEMVPKEPSMKRFPRADLDDPCIMVSSATDIIGSDGESDRRTFCHFFGKLDTESPGNERVSCYRTEREMMIGWFYFFLRFDPDFVTGFNIDGFDMPYLLKRAKQLGLDHWPHLCRHPSARVWYREEKTDKKQRGGKGRFSSMTKHTVAITGRVVLDALKWARKELKLRSYTLNSVAGEILGESKVQMHYSHIVSMWEGPLSSDETRKRLRIYCDEDAGLPLRCIIKRNVIFLYVFMSKLSGVTVGDVANRGQTIRSVTMLYRRHQTDAGDDIPFAWPMPEKDASKEFDQGYTGGLVLDPKPGLYGSDPMTFVDVVVILDYVSLYPTLTDERNISSETKVLVPIGEKPPEGLDCRSTGFVTGGYEVHMVRKRVRQGSLAREERRLMEARFAVKKQQAEAVAIAAQARAKAIASDLAEDWEAVRVADHKALIFEIIQLAIKLMANAMYGAKGASTSALADRDVAGAVANVGREFLGRLISWIRINRPIAEIVYGDSVSADTPILCRFAGGHVGYRAVCEIAMGCVWEKRGGEKEEAVYSNEGGLEVWSDMGWTRVKRVIRHTTGVRLVRVFTHTGCVDVTPDHSLLRPNGETVPASEVRLGEELMHAGLPEVIPAEVYDVGKISYEEQGREFAKAGRGEFHDRRKRVPYHVLNASEENRRAFWEGFCSKAKDSSSQIRVMGKIGAAGIFFLASSLGYNVSVRQGNKHRDHFGLFAGTRRHNRSADEIKQIFPLDGGTSVVYDIETENHHFAAGIGRLVVHNTDSLMFKPNEKWMLTIQDVRKYGLEVVGQYNETLKADEDEIEKNLMKLEFEAAYKPGIWTEVKKRYITNAWKMHSWVTGEPFGITSHGVETVRRDNCPKVGEIILMAVDGLLGWPPKPKEQVLEELLDAITRFKQGEFTLHDLVISAGVNKLNYDGANTAFDMLKRLNGSDPGEWPMQTGVRMFWVICKNPAAKGVSESAFHPMEVVARDLEPDLGYYMDHQIMPALMRLIGSVYTETELSVFTRKIKAVPVTELPMSALKRAQLKRMHITATTTCSVCLKKPTKGYACDFCGADPETPSKIRALMRGPVASMQESRKRCLECTGGFEDVAKACTAWDCPVYYKRLHASSRIKELMSTSEETAAFAASGAEPKEMPTRARGMIGGAPPMPPGQTRRFVGQKCKRSVAAGLRW